MTPKDSDDILLRIYSAECPQEAIEYAENAYLRHLSAYIESGDLSVSNTVSLGTPFEIPSDVSDLPVYYFPIISDGKVIATFRVYPDYVQSTDDGDTIYAGIMSLYLVGELNALMEDTELSSPVFLYMDNDNVMERIDNDVNVLVPSPKGEPPMGIEVTPSNLNVVALTDTLDSASTEELIMPYTISKYLDCNIIETQGNNQWCYAYASSMIIRYCTGNNQYPKARDIMEMYYSVLTDDSYLTQAQVVDAGYQFGLHPRYIARTISPYAEIDADRPIFLHSTDGNPLFGHALVMRGYNISSNVYSIWNPWRNYFESMDISTNIYVADSSTSFEWTKTIYGWA